MSKYDIECPTCAGSGKTKLPEDLRLMLSEFYGGRELCASDFEEKCNSAIKATAFNNRLEKLRAMGFLDRTKYGKTYFYFKPRK